MQFCVVLPVSGPDGRFGGTSIKLMDPSAGGEAAVGLDTSDPAAKDDCGDGHDVFAGGPRSGCEFAVGGRDPQLFVPNLRFKQDAVPGLNIHLHFKPTAIGEYEIACAELCGLGHYKMHAWYMSSARKISISG